MKYEGVLTDANMHSLYFFQAPPLKVPPRLCKPKLSDRIKGNGGRNNGKEGKEPHAAAD